MSRRWNVFALGRMRHLDLLALWFQQHAGEKVGPQDYWLAALSKEKLIAAIVGGTPAPPRT